MFDETAAVVTDVTVTVGWLSLFFFYNHLHVK
jgi:hypothetical protein